MCCLFGVGLCGMGLICVVLIVGMFVFVVWCGVVYFGFDVVYVLFEYVVFCN